MNISYSVDEEGNKYVKADDLLLALKDVPTSMTKEEIIEQLTNFLSNLPDLEEEQYEPTE